ncbi:hypothetical protein PVL29_019282 [Vitis rotundifolia]|uniref:3-dehydroquinate synthase n=1 Tax=Vitis rotundifolia TaxID=103349 RepID=A0AA38Z746_VITRO|nr:hypothetical protein PVL29_019282 [Vitis rotundifolia]
MLLVKSKSCRLISWEVHSITNSGNNSGKRAQLQFSSRVTMCSSHSSSVTSAGYRQHKVRGWNNFIFPPDRRELATEWSSIALIHPLFIEEGKLFDSEGRGVATFYDVTSPQQLQLPQPEDKQADNVIINLLDWQVIPAENIVAAFQGSHITVFAISKSSSEAQIFLEALEQGLGGVVLKVEDATAVLELKDYFDRRNEDNNMLSLTKATITQIHISGMGDRACVDLCSFMRPGEGLLVGSFARGLFLVHSECLELNYIASRPFRVNAGPVHAYVAIPGGKTCYLSELVTGKEVIVGDSDNGTLYSVLQNAETVALICPSQGSGYQKKAIPVTSLKVGDEVLLRVQGGARHTGIEIQEFIVEK